MGPGQKGESRPSRYGCTRHSCRRDGAALGPSNPCSALRSAGAGQSCPGTLQAATRSPNVWNSLAPGHVSFPPSRHRRRTLEPAKPRRCSRLTPALPALASLPVFFSANQKAHRHLSSHWVWLRGDSSGLKINNFFLKTHHLTVTKPSNKKIELNLNAKKVVKSGIVCRAVYSITNRLQMCGAALELNTNPPALLGVQPPQPPAPTPHHATCTTLHYSPMSMSNLLCCPPI